MATGFEKFSKKALSEEPISLLTKKDKPAEPAERPAPAKTQQPGDNKVVTRVNRKPVQETVQTEPAAPAPVPVAASPATPTVEEGSAASKRGRRPKPVTGEEIFAMSIKVKMSTKLKLDELKFRQRMTIQDLCEEAFADLYDKYSK